jgi:hypothetical protein
MPEGAHPVFRMYMKRCLSIVAALSCILAAYGQAALSPRFRTVYIVPMPNSMEEYLASCLTSTRVLWVVLQPSNADAVLTDTLDEDFWSWLERSYGSGSTAPAEGTDAGYRRPASFYPHSGTIFLVDPRRRVVLWSTYNLPKNTSPDELNRTAVHIVNQLRSAFGKK